MEWVSRKKNYLLYSIAFIVWIRQEVENMVGMGLGLSIAKGLLDIYQGTLEVDSVYGKWTKVQITFPLDR